MVGVAVGEALPGEAAETAGKRAAAAAGDAVAAAGGAAAAAVAVSEVAAAAGERGERGEAGAARQLSLCPAFHAASWHAWLGLGLDELWHHSLWLQVTMVTLTMARLVAEVGLPAL